MSIVRTPSERRRPLLFTAGLLTALSFTLVAFEWRSPFVAPTLPYDRGLLSEEPEYPTMPSVLPIHFKLE